MKPFPDNMSWNTDGQGNSWGHFPEDNVIDRHWLLTFTFGFIIGGAITSLVWSLL